MVNAKPIASAEIKKGAILDLCSIGNHTTIAASRLKSSIKWFENCSRGTTKPELESKKRGDENSSCW